MTIMRISNKTPPLATPDNHVALCGSQLGWKSVTVVGISDWATLIYFYQHIRLAAWMMSAETEVEEYYGYNSIITQDGKRIRRMRRTEASTEKLIISRLKSASNSRSVSSRRSKLQDNRPGNLSISMDPNKSKQQSRCTNYLKTHFYKEKIDPQTQYLAQHQTLQNVSKPKHNKTEKSLKDVKEKIGQYYLGEARASRQSSSKKDSKNRSRSKKESQIKVEKKTGSASVPQTPKPPEISDYCMSPIASKKKVKRFQKPTKQIELFSDYAQLMPKDGDSELKSEPSGLQSSLKDSIRNRSRLNLKVNKSKSKLSRISLKDKISRSQFNNSLVSQSQNSSQLMNSGLKEQPQYKPRQYIHREKEENKGSKYSNSNDYYMENSPFVEDQEIMLSKRSLIHVKGSVLHEPAEDNFSKISSHAEKLKSKIRQRKEKSKLSIFHELKCQQKQEDKISLRKDISIGITKKSTQTDESNESSEYNINAFCSRKNIEATLKSSGIMSDNGDNSTSELKGNSKIGNQKHVMQMQMDKSLNLSDSACDKSAVSQDSSDNKKENDCFSKDNQKIRNSVDSFRNLPLSSACPSMRPSQNLQISKIQKKKSLSAYTFNDVVQNIEQHEMRLGFMYLFVDNTKSAYEGPLKFERYERLCFLMLKKYLYQKERTIKSLKGEINCFTLTDAEIPIDVLKKHINRQQVRERMNVFLQQEKEIFRQLENQYHRINRKYSKDRLIKLQSSRDNFSKQIMKLMMEELTKLYQQLQNDEIDTDRQDANEQRIIEIVEIMFLISELSGRQVKKFDLLQENIVDFDEYYSDNYEKIMQTAEHFEKMRE